MRHSNPHHKCLAPDIGVPRSSREILVELTDSGEIRVLTGTPVFSASAPDDVSFYVHGYSSGVKFVFPLQPPQSGCVTLVAVLTRNLQVLSDHAGAYPLYQAFSADGNLFLGTDAWNVARAAGRSSLNYAACFDLLAYEYVPGYDTMIEGLNEISPGICFNLKYDGSEWICEERAVWSLERKQSLVPVSVEAAYDNLIEITRNIPDTGHDNSRLLVVNLSGGWDSRACLAAVYGHDAHNLFTCSYGNPKYPGVKIAAKVSDVLRLAHQLFPFNNASFLMENYHTLCGAMPPTSRFNLADGALAMGRSFYGDSSGVLCGHGGDNLTKLPDSAGASYLNSEPRLTKWLSTHMRSSFFERTVWPLLKTEAPAVAEQMNVRLAETVPSLFIPGSGGAFHWKLRHRIRRIVSVELRMLERFTPVVYVPMLEKSFIDFWMAVPDDQLVRQHLYRRMMAEKLFTGKASPLAQIPRESGTNLDPNAPLAGLKDVARKNYLRLLRHVAPSMAARETAADPTAMWWRSDPVLRKWAWEQLADSQFMQSHFDEGQLYKLVRDPNPSDPSFAQVGIWNMLTVAGVEAHCRSKS